MVAKILLHSLLALPFMASGWFLRGMCEHFWRHKVPLGAFMLVIEATLQVTLVG